MNTDERFHEICRYIEARADEPLRLDELALRAKMTRAHFARAFKAAVGVTPGTYREAARLRRLKAGLKRGEDVTNAIYDAGFGSASRVYERADTRLGMTPRQYRSGGNGIAISYASAATPLGTILIGATDRGICFVQFGDEEGALLEQLRKEYPAAEIAAMREPENPQLQAWLGAIVRHLEDAREQLALPLDIRATAFQMRVWRYLQTIPAGEVRSYSEVANAIGKPKAARAVANVCASNRVAIVIPCHRVIRESGQLGGYRWGLERKRALIDRERAAARG
jgi:AraC family transcriptional regulator of adaptative response/methylated-DNA-[protein]-cysteine methyltransferase